MTKETSSSALKKNQLIAEVAHRSGESKATTRAILDAAADVTRDALSEGMGVFLIGVGKLEVHERGEKTARNLHTGERVVVPKRNVILFRPSESVKAAINPAE